MEYKENCLTHDVYSKLRDSVGWNNFDKEQVDNALQRSAYDIVVYKNSQEIGMGRIVGDGIYYTIVDIIVSPKFQGQGIGKKIISKILDFVIETTPNNARVSVQLISEKGKETFYEQHGFKKIPNTNCGAGMRKVIYK